VHSLFPFTFAFRIVAKLLCYSHCLFYVIVDLHLLYRKMFDDFLVGIWKCIVCVLKIYLFHDFYSIYGGEAFITSK
jgi:hypothetical protein